MGKNEKPIDWRGSSLRDIKDDDVFTPGARREAGHQLSQIQSGLDQREEQVMTIETKSAHVTPAGGNVFADLGFDPEEAATLKAESTRIISEKLAIKDALMTEISGWIKAGDLKQSEAAEILGISRPRVSDVVNRKAVKFTIDALIDMLARTGKHVQLFVR